MVNSFFLPMVFIDESDLKVEEDIVSFFNWLEFLLANGVSTILTMPVEFLGVLR